MTEISEKDGDEANRAEWEAYRLKLEQAVEEIEDKLSIDRGTIKKNIVFPEHNMIIGCYAIIETILNTLLSAKLFSANSTILDYVGGVSPIEEHVSALGLHGKSGKLRLASNMRLISKEDKRWIEDIALLRNRYAHNIRNFGPKIPELCDKMGDDGRGVKARFFPNGVQSDKLVYSITLQTRIYYRLAFFIDASMHLMRPPPMPPGGVFGLLSGLVAPSPLFTALTDATGDDTREGSGATAPES